MLLIKCPPVHKYSPDKEFSEGMGKIVHFTIISLFISDYNIHIIISLVDFIYMLTDKLPNQTVHIFKCKCGTP